MEQLRFSQKEDLHRVAEFITDRFWEYEQYTFLADGLSEPKEILTKVTEAALPLFLSKGDIYIYGEQKIQGVLVGIPIKKYTMLNILLSSFSTSKLLKDISKDDMALLKEKGESSAKIHDKSWHKKYSKNAYYIFQIAVAKENKGTGVFRKLITPVLDMCDERQMDVILETNTKDNILIYEHFGFDVVEQHKSADMPYAEYCMILRRNVEMRSAGEKNGY